MAASVARGCHLSFAGPVSWPEARKPLEALRLTPRDRLLVETDAPDQAPAPHRGGRNEPAFLVHIVEAMATALGEPVDSTGALLAENARRLFPGIPALSGTSARTGLRGARRRLGRRPELGRQRGDALEMTRP